LREFHKTKGETMKHPITPEAQHFLAHQAAYFHTLAQVARASAADVAEMTDEQRAAKGVHTKANYTARWALCEAIAKQMSEATDLDALNTWLYQHDRQAWESLHYQALTQLTSLARSLAHVAQELQG
jgi:hypothetical protein